MATSAAAALLDELMGRTRNCDPNERPSELNWKDETVCKYFLCGFCPHELFTNTRADLGLCNKIHDEALRKQYQESSRFEKEGYEEDFLHFLQNMISDVEKRIRRGHQRLALNNNQNLNGGLPSAKEDKITMLTDKINELVSQAEELGGEGKVEEAQGVMKLCDQLKEERMQIQNQASTDEGPQVKQMEVCEVCGAFLIVGDAPQRQDEHLMGKQHAGYAQVRAEIEKIKMKKKAVLEEKEQKRQMEREERDRAVEREREDRRRREKEREDRERREREKGRDRDRRRRSRSRSHGRRSRSKDRRRSGSRERRRSRDRRRHSRSRSHERKNSKSSRRSRSRDKEGSSSRRDREYKRDRERSSHSRSKDQGGDRRLGSNGDHEGWSRGHSPDEEGMHSEGDTKKD
ncbi:luc7-like protein 3 isoform X2 [Babylonia areolata]|uniref:luc7-like protein 3 isoform X2 n=1 Tax=Babylonia areolata TaxID=304850 RepID=UPI003FD31768